MDKKGVKGKKAAERLQRLLNTDFDKNKFEIVIQYENLIKNRTENRQQAID